MILDLGLAGPVMYNDLFYGTDLEVRAFGTFSIQLQMLSNLSETFFLPM